MSVDYVQTELEKKADEWRTDFIARAGKIFVVSGDIESEYAGVIANIEADSEFKANGARGRFMVGADPWVIARARNIGDCTVVSAETKLLAQYGLGPVCKKLGVDHMNLVEFFEENKIGV